MATTYRFDPDALLFNLDAVLADGVPPWMLATARQLGRLDLTTADGTAVRLLHEAWPPGPGGTWYAKGRENGRTFTGYCGGHAPRGGGVPGLSAEGVRRGVEGVERQAKRWASGEAKPRVRGPVCPCCHRETYAAA